MKESCQKVQQKLVPYPFLILVNNPKQPLRARNFVQEIFLYIRFFERGLSKSPKKVHFIFSFEPSLF